MAQNDRKAEMRKITERLEAGIKELFESERYKEYLDVMSRFHNYSFNNTILIASQKPTATRIAGYSAWKNNFGRNVKRGEKGIRIIAPSPYKMKIDMEKIDPHTQKPVIGKDGKAVMEEKEVTIPAFRVVTVFDISQTEGKELPDIAVELTGDVEQYEDFFTALERTSPFTMGFEALGGNTKGCCFFNEQRIVINEGMSELQNVKTAIHEIAHAKRHNFDIDSPDRPDRRTREVEAESIAYIVCQHYGLDTSDYSFGYIALWSSGKELTELKTSLETIRVTASEIIHDVDEHFAELQKEREAEIAQEAASVGMTVEKYAANGYEPYNTSEQKQVDMPITDRKGQNRVPRQAKKESIMSKLAVNKAVIERREHQEKGGLEHKEREWR